MPQDRFINITLDPNVAVKKDRKDDTHGGTFAAAGASDLTLSYDTAKFTSLSVLRSAVKAALDRAAQTMAP